MNRTPLHQLTLCCIVMLCSAQTSYAMNTTIKKALKNPLIQYSIGLGTTCAIWHHMHNPGYFADLEEPSLPVQNFIRKELAQQGMHNPEVITIKYKEPGTALDTVAALLAPGLFSSIQNSGQLKTVGNHTLLIGSHMINNQQTCELEKALAAKNSFLPFIELPNESAYTTNNAKEILLQSKFLCRREANRLMHNNDIQSLYGFMFFSTCYTLMQHTLLPNRLARGFIGYWVLPIITIRQALKIYYKHLEQQADDAVYADKKIVNAAYNFFKDQETVSHNLHAAMQQEDFAMRYALKAWLFYIKQCNPQPSDAARAERLKKRIDALDMKQN